MKTHNKTKWLIPYIESVKDLIPTHRIIALKGYKVPKNKYAAQYGACLKDEKGKFTINMRLYRYDQKTKKYVSLYLGHILETFAHELSHTKVWDHSPKHMYYTGLILSRFEKVLKAQGIKDTYKHRMIYD